MSYGCWERQVRVPVEKDSAAALSPPAHNDLRTPGMVHVGYIFLTAVFNVALGFAVAAYLGRRYRERSAWVERVEAIAPIPFRDGGQPRREPTAPSPEPPATIVAEETEPPDAPVEEPNRHADAFTDPDEAPEYQEPNRAKSASEQSVLGFQKEVLGYHDRLSEIDDRLRSCAEKPELAAVRSCLSALLEANQSYIEQRSEVAAEFLLQHKGQRGFESATRSVQAAMASQSDQIKLAGEAAEAFDYAENLGAGCRQMLGEAVKLLAANHGLRDALDAAVCSVARNEDFLGVIGDPARKDPVTGLRGRAGLEAGLAKWWQKDPHRSRPLTLALIDLDEFANINEQYGHRTGDKVLRAIGQLLESERRDESAACRLAGQRFLVIFPDTDVRAATGAAERIRQTIESSRFQLDATEIRLTASCAVTEAGPEDTCETLLARLDATIHEAKRSGRNRTFVHEGEPPAPVVPPSLDLDERHVDL